MTDAHAFLRDLTLVLATAAVTTVVFQKLRQPVVLGYLLAGAIISPHTPIPLVASLDTVHTLSELGVILLMFSLGLEFSLRKLVKVGPRAAFVALVQSSLMIWVGFVVGRALGWTTLESLFAGAAIAISSTTIIVKAFGEQKLDGQLTQLVFAVLIVEDLIAIMLLAVLTSIATGAGVSAGSVLMTILRLAGFLAVILVFGYLLIPRTVRFVVKLDRPETTLVASIGICFGLAYVAQAAGYSVALGSFIAGSLIAESKEEKRIEHLVEPVRDMFAAIFFVSVGMLLEPKLIAEHWGAVLAFTALVIVGKLVGVTLGAFLGGYGTRTSIQAGMSLAQIGEFSFIIASLALTLGASRPFLYPVAVTVSALTTLTTPWLIRVAPSIATKIDRRLPKPVQTFAALYASWVERLGNDENSSAWAKAARSKTLWLLVDAGCILVVIVGAALARDRVIGILDAIGLSPAASRALSFLGQLVLLAPFVVGALRCARALASIFTGAIFEKATGTGELASSSRRMLVVVLYLALILAVGTPILAISQPFLPRYSSASVFLGAIVVALFAFWRSARALDAGVRAGAQIVVDALEEALPKSGHQTGEHSIPELGTTSAIRLTSASFAAGKSLAELDLRGRTGAMVVAMERGNAARLPSAKEPLLAGDVLAVTGTKDSVEAAVLLLGGGPS